MALGTRYLGTNEQTQTKRRLKIEANLVAEGPLMVCCKRPLPSECAVAKSDKLQRRNASGPLFPSCKVLERWYYSVQEREFPRRTPYAASHSEGRGIRRIYVASCSIGQRPLPHFPCPTCFVMSFPNESARQDGRMAPSPKPNDHQCSCIKCCH
jgi:hypothetical protein